MKTESAEEMRERLRRESFLRSLFWQGEHGAGELTPLDAAEVYQMKEQSRQQHRGLRFAGERV